MKATIVSHGPVKRFRYILCGVIDFDGPINHYRLIGGNNLGDAASCVRVKLPNLFHLNKYSCDPYATTNDVRSLNELGYDIMVKINGRWVVRNDLKPIQPHKIYHAMMQENRGYAVPKLGYLTPEQYKAYNRKRDEKIRNALKSGKLPNEPEYADKYVLVWDNNDGSIDYYLSDDAECIKISQKAMEKIGGKTRIIKPASQKGE